MLKQEIMNVMHDIERLKQKALRLTKSPGVYIMKDINDKDFITINTLDGKKSIFNGASKDEILGYLVDAKERKWRLFPF